MEGTKTKCSIKVSCIKKSTPFFLNMMSLSDNVFVDDARHFKITGILHFSSLLPVDFRLVPKLL